MNLSRLAKNLDFIGAQPFTQSVPSETTTCIADFGCWRGVLEIMSEHVSSFRSTLAIHRDVTDLGTSLILATETRHREGAWNNFAIRF